MCTGKNLQMTKKIKKSSNSTTILWKKLKKTYSMILSTRKNIDNICDNAMQSTNNHQLLNKIIILKLNNTKKMDELLEHLI